MTVFLLSLGLPPMAGFIGGVRLQRSRQSGLCRVAIIALTSVVPSSSVCGSS
jgi:NADH:ubiquinone oxidoreductase subunit 2 (subunit N)